MHRMLQARLHTSFRQSRLEDPVPFKVDSRELNPCEMRTKTRDRGGGLARRVIRLSSPPSPELGSAWLSLAASGSALCRAIAGNLRGKFRRASSTPWRSWSDAVGLHSHRGWDPANSAKMRTNSEEIGVNEVEWVTRSSLRRRRRLSPLRRR